MTVTTFALSRVDEQVHLGAGSDPRVTFEYKTGRLGGGAPKKGA